MKRFQSSIFVYLIGILFSILLWWLATLGSENVLHRFAPHSTFIAFGDLISAKFIWNSTFQTLGRLLVGLGIAIGVGVPVGVLTGYIKILNKASYIPFQFIRMISPLSWMPVAIILFGIGSGPVYFLIAIAAIWPVIINTSSGIQSVEKEWKELGIVLGGRLLQRIIHIHFRASLPTILTGIRVGLGVGWIVLVPAEMLGVASGLGYMILDFRDINDYSSIMAVIMMIGTLGVLIDLPLQWAIRRLSW